MKLEHIGIAVNDLTAANALFEKLLGAAPYKTESVAAEKVTTSFFRSGSVKIELLESTDPEGPVGKFIRSRGAGLHHIAFEVDDLLATAGLMKESGFHVLGDPFPGADNKMVFFIHPRSAGGVLVEFCQERK